MLENFSVEAQEVVSLATMEARRLNHRRVGTEHLLLGLLSDDDGEPAELLKAAGAHLVAARHKVVEAVGDDVGSPDGEALPFSDRAQRALERAGRFSRKDRESVVNAGHVLLGVLDVEGLACQVLRGLDVDLVQLRHAAIGRGAVDPVPAVGDDTPRPDAPVEASVDASVAASVAASAAASAAALVGPSSDIVRPRCARCDAALDDTLAEMVMPVRRDGQPAANVSVVYCSACGAALGVVRS